MMIIVRSLRLRRAHVLSAIASLLVVGTVASCSLGVSTSDYVSASTTSGDGGGGDAGGDRGDGTAGGDSPTGSDGPSGGPAAAHVALFGGTRDTLNSADQVFLSEVLIAPIDANGNFGAWIDAMPTPFAGGFRPFLADGYLFGYAYFWAATFALEWVPFDGGINGAWGAKGSHLAPGPPITTSSVALLGQGVWSFGGETSVTPDGGGNTVFTVYADVDMAAFNPSTQAFGAWQPASAQLSKPRSRVSLFTHNSNVYVIGGIDASKTALPDIEFASLNAAGDTLGPFQTTTPLSDPLTGIPRGLLSATVVATDTMLYVIGGASDSSDTPSDLVMMAPLNPDGTIGQWALGPPLPNALRGHRAFIRNGVIYVMGGSVTTTSRTDQVLTAHIQADGTLSSWTPQDSWKLPTARSDFGVLVY
jgi:hypothetical protein